MYPLISSNVHDEVFSKVSGLMKKAVIKYYGHEKLLPSNKKVPGIAIKELCSSKKKIL